MKKIVAKLIKLAIELEERGFAEEAAELDRIAGIFDFMKRKKEVKMPSKTEKIHYIVRQIDEALAKTKPAQRSAVLEQMLTKWKISPREPEGVEILTLLKNYTAPAMRSKKMRPKDTGHWSKEDKDRWIN